MNEIQTKFKYLRLHHHLSRISYYIHWSTNICVSRYHYRLHRIKFDSRDGMLYAKQIDIASQRKKYGEMSFICQLEKWNHYYSLLKNVWWICVNSKTTHQNIIYTQSWSLYYIKYENDWNMYMKFEINKNIYCFTIHMRGCYILQNVFWIWLYGDSYHIHRKLVNVAVSAK